MLLPREYDRFGLRVSPGGHEFGLQGWTPPEQRISSITFFIDGTTVVCDQIGRPIRGTVKSNGTLVYFATMPPQQDNPKPGHRTSADGNGKLIYVKLASHTETVEALKEEGIDWIKLNWAGWPQLPYEELKKLDRLPGLPFAERHEANSPIGASCTCIMCAIRDPKIRKDTLRIMNDRKVAREKEMAAVEVVEAQGA